MEGEYGEKQRDAYPNRGSWDRTLTISNLASAVRLTPGGDGTMSDPPGQAYDRSALPHSLKRSFSLS